jgi:hypothetical protein
MVVSPEICAGGLRVVERVGYTQFKSGAGRDDGTARPAFIGTIFYAIPL